MEWGWVAGVDWPGVDGACFFSTKAKGGNGRQGV